MRRLLNHKILTLLAGIATAFVIIFSQLFYFQAATYCQAKVKTEHHDQKKSDPKKGTTETHISIPSSSIATTSHIEINQDLSFVLEILFERDHESETGTNFSIPVSQYFQTLFRFIISSNAP